MAGRMTVCNMSIEAGARAGMIAPDHVTFEYLRGRQFAPAEGDFEAACALWRALHSDQGAKFDRIADIDAASIAPMVTRGTSPEDRKGVVEGKSVSVRVKRGGGRLLKKKTQELTRNHNKKRK